MNVALRATLLAVLSLSVRQVPAQEIAHQRDPSLLKVLQSEGLPGTEPVTAEASVGSAPAPFRAALVEKSAGAMSLVLVRRTAPGQFEVVARSAPIGGLRGSNFGFGIESFRFNAPDRLELGLSARTSCARALYTHRFALRRGSWMVTGLDVEMPRCNGGSLVGDWAESTNYLSGTTRRTEFARPGTPRISSGSSVRQPFPISQFPPSGPEPTYAQMQP